MSRRYWYSYLGGNYTSISNYVLVSGVFCSGGPELCVMYALYGGDIHPSSISNNLNSYIGILLTSQVPEPRGSKPYVYGHPVV